ncbi:MAG: prephenate dehydrogenase [Thermomicrobiales bacterium]
MQRVAIIGLGLIGGSIGLGLKRWSAEQAKSGGAPALEVVGFDTDLDQQHFAKKLGTVDRAEWELAKVVRDADLIVVAAPVRAIKETFANIAPLLKAGATVTDVGSTKAEVLQWADELLPRTVHFIGGHPMAGKAVSIEGADADLFKDATWCVAPSVHASDEAVRTVLGMITALGAEAYFVDPLEHDAYVAGISHLPFVLSSALMTALSQDSSWRDMKTLTSGGFRDMTRLAAGATPMHRDIVMTNRASILRWVEAFQGELTRFSEAMSGDDEAIEKQLTAYFDRSRNARAEWATQTTREGELLQSTETELTKEGVGDQMGRMLFGGMFRRRGLTDRVAKSPARRPGPNDRNGTTPKP